MDRAVRWHNGKTGVGYNNLFFVERLPCRSALPVTHTGHRHCPETYRLRPCFKSLCARCVPSTMRIEITTRVAPHAGYEIRDTDYGILLSVRWLGLSSSRALSISDIISC